VESQEVPAQLQDMQLEALLGSWTACPARGCCCRPYEAAGQGLAGPASKSWAGQVQLGQVQLVRIMMAVCVAGP
jgi:hypothetical protein